MKEILVLYYSQHGAIKQLAHLIARGINSIDGVSARIRTVPKIKIFTAAEQQDREISKEQEASIDEPIYATYDDLKECAGLALGSPVRFGNMAAALKYFLDGTVDSWLNGHLVNKPACVFTSAGSMHGGHEACLLSMMLPLLHHGMLIMGIPYTVNELMNTTSGGTPYGVSHWAGISNEHEISESERQLALAQGERIAELCLKITT